MTCFVCFVFQNENSKKLSRKKVSRPRSLLSVCEKKVKRERIFIRKNAHSEKKKRTLFAVLVDRKKKEMDARKIY